jgi:hypothetical protein
MADPMIPNPITPTGILFLAALVLFFRRGWWAIQRLLKTSGLLVEAAGTLPNESQIAKPRV